MSNLKSFLANINPTTATLPKSQRGKTANPMVARFVNYLHANAADLIAALPTYRASSVEESDRQGLQVVCDIKTQTPAIEWAAGQAYIFNTPNAVGTGKRNCEPYPTEPKEGNSTPVHVGIANMLHRMLQEAGQFQLDVVARPDARPANADKDTPNTYSTPPVLVAYTPAEAAKRKARYAKSVAERRRATAAGFDSVREWRKAGKPANAVTPDGYGRLVPAAAEAAS
jgi:hypothetical protein